jgi:hypothetical protein
MKEIPEMENEQNESLGPKPVQRCRWCKQPIHPQAQLCPHCRGHQDPSRWQAWKTPSTQMSLVSAVIAFVMMLLAFDSARKARQERIDASEAFRQTQIAANVTVKMIRVLADGAGVFGGPTSEHYHKIGDYEEELKGAGILIPDLEAQIQKDLQEIHEENRLRLNRDPSGN